MQLEARMACQPALDGRMFMGGVIVSPPICKPDKSNGLEFRFDLPFSCQASAKTLLHLVLFSSMCRLIPYLVPGGPSANTESASDFPTGGFIRFFRRCSQLRAAKSV